MWWTTLTGRVVNVDEFTGEPTPTDLFPSEIASVPCDACPFWDVPSACDTTVVVEEPDDVFVPITVSFCGATTPLTLALTAGGLFFMGLTRRSRGRG